MLKLMKRSGTYRNATGTLMVNAYSLKGTSYGWYKISDSINGTPVLNTYRYSVTTGKHVRDVRDLFRRLGVREYLEIEAPHGLQDLFSAEKHYQEMITELHLKVIAKRSRASKNKERAKRIGELEQTLSMIRVLQE